MEASQMKKFLSVIVSALVAVSFAGVVSAAEVVKSDVKSETTTVTPAGETKTVKKAVKKSKKTSKKGKTVTKTKDVKETTVVPAPAAK
jgi:hypothetical protein